MTRRFEFQDGSSSKFWAIDLDGCSVTTTWGRIGTSGQSKSKDFDSESKAKKEYDKLIVEKQTKGYVEVEADANTEAHSNAVPVADAKISSAKESVLEDIFVCMKLWLKEHDGAIVHSFAKNAPVAELEELEAQVGKKLPADYKCLYHTFNRLDDDVQEKEVTTKLFGGFFFMPLRGVDGVLTEHESFEDIDYSGGGAEGPVKRMLYNELWVPFAKDFGGNFIGVDLDPASGGEIGQVIRFGRDETPTVLAPNLVHFFIANCLGLGIALPSSLQGLVGEVHNKAKVISLYSDDAEFSENELDAEEVDDEAVVEADFETKSRPSKAKKEKNANGKDGASVAFAKIAGVGKKVLREPSLMVAGLEFLLQSLDSEKENVRASAMEEINEIACERYCLPDMVDYDECSKINELFERCGEKIQALLAVATTKTEAEEAMKALTELKFEKALPEIIKCLDNSKTRLEAVWCLGKFGQESASAAKELINIIQLLHKQMGSQGEVFSTVEAALIGLEEMQYAPQNDDEIFGALVVSKDASIAALCCRLLSRNAVLVRKYTDYIKPLVYDKRGRLSESAQQALSAVK